MVHIKSKLISDHVADAVIQAEYELLQATPQLVGMVAAKVVRHA